MNIGMNPQNQSLETMQSKLQDTDSLKVQSPCKISRRL